MNLINKFSIRNGAKYFSWSVKLTKNVDPDKYKYREYGTGFDFRSEFSFRDRTMGRNVIIFVADMSSSVHVANKNKNILILDQGPPQGLDTTLTVEAKCPINFTQPNERFVLIYTAMEATVSYLLMLPKLYQFKTKKLWNKRLSLCLDNISKKFTINSMKEMGLAGL